MNIWLSLQSLILPHTAAFNKHQEGLLTPNMLPKPVELLIDIIQYSITITKRLVEAASSSKNNYTFINRKQQTTCHELILEAAARVHVAINSFDYPFLETDFQTPVNLMTKLYVEFFETEGTIVNDSRGIGGDIKELLKSMRTCLVLYSPEIKACVVETRRIKSSFFRIEIDETMNRCFFHKVHMGDNMPSKKQILKSVNTNYIPTDGRNWQASYNPNVEPAIDLLHQLTTSAAETIHYSSIHFSSNGKLVAAAYDTKVGIYNIETEAVEHVTYNPQITSEVKSVCFSPHEQHVAIAKGKMLTIWDISQQRFIHSLIGHLSIIYSAVYSPNGKYIFSGAYDKTVKIWHVENEQCIHTLGDQDGPTGMCKVAVSPDGKLVAAGTTNHTVMLWDTNTGSLLSQYQAHTDRVCDITFSSNGGLLASCASAKTIKLWDISSGTCCSTFTYHRGPVTSVTISPKNGWLASGSDDKSVMFWDLRAPHLPRAMLLGHTDPVTRVAFSPLGGVFATCSRGRMRVWKGW